MKKFSAILFSLSCFATSVFAQTVKETKLNLSPLTRHYLQQLKNAGDAQPEGYIYKTIQGQQYVSAMIKVADVSVEQKLQALGVSVGTKAGNIWTVQVP